MKSLLLKRWNSTIGKPLLHLKATAMLAEAEDGVADVMVYLIIATKELSVVEEIRAAKRENFWYVLPGSGKPDFRFFLSEKCCIIKITIRFVLHINHRLVTDWDGLRDLAEKMRIAEGIYE